MNKNNKALEQFFKNFGMGYALFIGILTRFLLMFKVGFPFNDGGLFYVMVTDIQANHYLLPSFSSYNGQQIPFVYPPLAFYLTGLINDLTHIPLIDLIRWIPFCFSLATIPIVYYLALAILDSKLKAGFSAILFAILTPAYDELLMGSGLTRSMGETFGLLALLWAIKYYKNFKIRDAFLLILFASLALLSHPVKAWFTCYSIVLFFLFFGRNWKGLLSTLLMGCGVLLFTAPWWGTFLIRHGTGPILTAFGSRNTDFLFRPLVNIWFFNFTNAPFLDMIGFLGLAGLIIAIIKRRYVLPVWLLVIIIIEQYAPLSLTAVPFCMLAAVGLEQIAIGISWLVISEKGTDEGSKPFLNYGAVVLVIFYIWISSYFAFKIPILSDDDILAQKWVSQNTAKDAKFAVLTGADWWQDPYSEWFPVLSERTSLATVQGFEWTTKETFNKRINRYKELQSCVQIPDMKCITHWQESLGEEVRYIFIPKRPDYQALDFIKKVIITSNQYEEIYDGSGASVFKKY